MKILNNKINNRKYLTRGFSLFIAVVIMGALLLAAYSISYLSSKELSLTTSNRESQYAYFAADAGIECALYWDSKSNPTKFDPSISGSPITCNGQSISTGAALGGTTTTAVIGGVSSSAGNSASFSGLDTTTQGNWVGTYGSQGYSIAIWAGSNSSLPPTITVSNTGSNYEWADPTSDIRGLLIPPSGPDRIASTWYTDSNFNIDVNITDGMVRQIALYLMDWNVYGGGRTERIDVVDVGSGTILDTRNASNFVNGVYYKWNISGHVRFVITNTNGSANAVVNALFVDPSTASGGSGTSVFGFSMESAQNSSNACAVVSVYKDASGNTDINSYGYNTCNTSDPKRVERGIEVKY